MAQKMGPTVNLGGGASFRLVVNYEFTTSAIMIRPYLAVAQPNFTKKKTLKIEWTKPGGTVTKTKSVKTTDILYYWNISNYQNVKSYSTKVTGIIAGKKSSVTITSNIKPAAPSSISFKFVNDSRSTVTVQGNGQKGVLTSNVTLQRKVDIDTAEWETVQVWRPGNNKGYSYTFTDQTTERGHRYKYRAYASNPNGSSGSIATDWDYTYPPDVSNVGHTRISNTKCTVQWQREGQAVDRSLITEFAIERSESGGAWERVGTAGAGSASAQTVTYDDETCSVNNWYSYRIKPINPRGTSIIAYDQNGTEPTYNTPAAPTSIKAVFTSSNNGLLTFSNTAKTATELEIERTDDGGSTWTQIAVVDESSAVVTEYLDETGITGDQVYYRLRNVREGMSADEKASPWAYSNTMSTLRKPSPPTLIIPANGTPINLDLGVAQLSWVHNPNDGTAQEAAQIQYRINDTYISTITLGAVAYYNLALDPSRFSANDVVTWRVRTKGAHSDYSEWSEYNNFTILTTPQISFTAPENGATIENLPLDLSWLYEDESGTLASLTLEIKQGAKTKATIDIPTGTGVSGEYTYSLSNFLFDNETTYDLVVTAVSSTGLSTAATISVSIEYVYVFFTNALYADAEFDEDTGVATLSLQRNEAPVDPEEGDVVIDSEVVDAYLYRRVADERVLVQGGLKEGDQVVDPYCPLNVPVVYELLQIAETGEISVVTQEYTFDSNYWYVYWGTDNENIARAIWDPSGDVNLTRPEKEQIRYSGRKYPVTYDSTAIEETFGFTGVTDDRDELNHFIQMIRDGGSGIWKSADGQCYDADFELSYSSDYTLNHLRWNIDLNVTRVDDGELVR